MSATLIWRGAIWWMLTRY